MTLKDVIDTDITNVFLNTDDFAEPFLFSRTATNVNGIFDDEFVVVIDNVETSKPAVSVKTTDVPGIEHRDTLTRISDSTLYYVIGIQPDVTGMTLVVLSLD